MTFTLKKVTCLKPEEIENFRIPYICDTQDTERLKRILYTALSYLHSRSEAEIWAAWEDTINLYNWFFEYQRQQIRQESNDIPSYMDLEDYIENSVEALELSYLSEVDVLMLL